MKAMHPYLFFDGDCRDAIEFYRDCLGGSLEVMDWGSRGDACPKGAKDLVMHACLQGEGFCLMASDRPGSPARAGDNVNLSIQCADLDEIETLFRALGDGGVITMALENTFWGARFGTLTDRFGIHWMLNCQMED